MGAAGWIQLIVCEMALITYRNTRLVVAELERVDFGKMNVQLIANEKNQDRA